MEEYRGRTDDERELLDSVSGGRSGFWYDCGNEDAYLELAGRLRLGGLAEDEVRRMLSDAYSAAISEHVLDQDPRD